MPKLKFKAIQAFLKTYKAASENNVVDRLCKARFLHNYIRRKCIKLYHPYENVSVDKQMVCNRDERMVHNRGHFTFRQFIKDTLTRWGIKLWVQADSKNAYTYDLEVYTGKGTPVSCTGLAYDVVMRLCKSLSKQGYTVYFNNFYTGVQLLNDLFANGTVCCGTLFTNCKGVWPALKETKTFSKGPRGQMRWVRQGQLLFFQWLDYKPVTLAWTIHRKAH